MDTNKCLIYSMILLDTKIMPQPDFWIFRKVRVKFDAVLAGFRQNGFVETATGYCLIEGHAPLLNEERKCARYRLNFSID